MDPSAVMKAIGGLLSRNSSTIFTGLAVGGVLGSVVMAISATPKALKLIMNAFYGVL